MVVVVKSRYQWLRAVLVVVVVEGKHSNTLKNNFRRKSYLHIAVLYSMGEVAESTTQKHSKDPRVTGKVVGLRLIKVPWMAPFQYRRHPRSPNVPQISSEKEGKSIFSEGRKQDKRKGFAYLSFFPDRIRSLLSV